MEGPNHNDCALRAFAILVLAICYLATVGAVLAYHERYAEALGFGGLTTGLVGVLGTFRPKATGGTQDVHVMNEEKDAVPIEDTKGNKK